MFIQKYCSFHINSEHSHESCGPRRGIEDVAQLLIVRYERNATDDEIGTEKQPKNFFEAVNYVKPDPASQLVAKYKGSGEISEVRIPHRPIFFWHLKVFIRISDYMQARFLEIILFVYVSCF